MRNFLVADRHLHWHSRDTVRPVYDEIFRRTFAKVRLSSTNIDFDALGHSFADTHVMLTTHVFLNIGRKVIAGHLDAIIRNNTAKRNHGDLCCATANVNNHISFRCINVQTYTDGGCHWFINQENVTPTCMLCRIAHSTKLHFRRARRDANHHAQCRRKEALTFMYHTNEAAHHLLTSIKVCNHAIAQWADNAYLIICLLVHQFGLFAHCNHTIRMFIQRYYRRLIYDNLIAIDDDCIGRT